MHATRANKILVLTRQNEIGFLAERRSSKKGGSQIRRTAFICATNRGVAIETREISYLSNSRTAGSFLASALCGGAIGKPGFGFPRARIRDIEPSVQACREVHAPTCPLF